MMMMMKCTSDITVEKWFRINCIYIHMNAHVCIDLFIYTHVYTYVHTHINIYIHTQIYVYTLQCHAIEKYIDISLSIFRIVDSMVIPIVYLYKY
jgi:hypothetical protein